MEHFKLLLQAGPVVKGVLILLFLLSAISWSIIVYKWRYFAISKKQSTEFYRLFRSSRDGAHIYKYSKLLRLSPTASLYRTLYIDRQSNIGSLSRTINRHVTMETSKLERHLSFLATTGSTGPFIGLFGTVWGIMGAFRGIGIKGSASLATVAPGIAEALVATAVGLFAAIPAVIGYNYLLSIARRMSLEIEDFSEDLYEFFEATDHNENPKK